MAFALLSLCVVLAHALEAADWPQFLGPARNGTTPDAVTTPWPTAGPARRWRVDAGAGFAGAVVAGDRAVLFSKEEAEDTVTAVDVLSGKRLWTQRQPTTFSDEMGSGDGPRSTPCIAEGRVFLWGADGHLWARDLVDGRLLWDVDTRVEFQADPGFFGFACSPLVIGDQVLLNVGGREGAGVAAWDTSLGKLRWKRTDQEAGYASPVPGTGASAGLALFFNREGLLGVSMPSGEERYRFPWRSRMGASVNAASPLVQGDDIFLTASYGTGAVLLRRQGDTLKTVWSGDESLSAHFATPVLHAGHLYGFHGRQERGAELRCVEWSTGRVVWRQEDLGPGSLVLAAGDLVILLESGELLVAPATPDGFRPAARAQILGRGARAPFAIAGGAVFARDTRHWICVGVGRSQPR
ncbi:MAG: PQQ-binding-like beta-propeller repeat protein [Verrucomicrobia bacterium]|nr:PQQ-binding-like beta-propeller repeat protein [Verrucomicrobiota bacterium]